MVQRDELVLTIKWQAKAIQIASKPFTDALLIKNLIGTHDPWWALITFILMCVPHNMIAWLPAFTRASSMFPFVCDYSELLSRWHSYYEPIRGCTHASMLDGIVKLFYCFFVSMPTSVIGIQQRSCIGIRCFRMQRYSMLTLVARHITVCRNCMCFHVLHRSE